MDTCIPTISRAMTAFPHSIDAGAHVSEARALMHEHELRHLPVMWEGRLAGVISDRDIGLAVGPDPVPSREDLLVRAVMIPDPYTVDLHTPLDEVLLEMAERHIGCTLVTRKGKLVGIFTSTDACRFFGQYLRAERKGSDADPDLA